MLIRDLLKELLPKLYNETRVRQDLIREVEMGPFKHTVDGKIYKKSFFFFFKIKQTFFLFYRWSRSS
jgi:hypothetical protein